MSDQSPDIAPREEPAQPVVPVARTPVVEGFHESAIRRALPIYYALMAAALTIGGILVLIRLQKVLLLFFIALLFASAISKPSARLERLGIPRAIAALMIYASALGVLVLIGWYVVPPLIQQVGRLADNAPAYADQYQELREAYEALAEEYPELGTFDQQFGGLRSRVISSVTERLLDLPTRLFNVFLDTLAVFVISMLIITSRERILAFILSMVHPRHRESTRHVLVKMWQRIGFYLRTKLFSMAIVGALTYVSLLLIGVPYALLLSIVVALGELVPRVGAWVARIPLLGIAALEGWGTLGLAFLSSVIIQNLEGSIISPFIQGDQLEMHPLLVFMAVLVGAVLLGPLGAFVAVPAAAMIQVFFEEVVIPWRKRQLASAESSDPV
jgi:predicted PurR-regulated permease PerM